MPKSSGSFEHRWVPRDEEGDCPLEETIYVVYVLTHRKKGKEPRHSLKQVTGRTAPCEKEPRKKCCTLSPGKRQEVCCLFGAHGKGSNEHSNSEPLQRSRCGGLRYLLREQIPTLISDLLKPSEPSVKQRPATSVESFQ